MYKKKHFCTYVLMPKQKMKRKTNEAHKIKRNNKKAAADLRDLKCIFFYLRVAKWRLLIQTESFYKRMSTGFCKSRYR